MTTLYIIVWLLALGALYLTAMYRKHRGEFNWESYGEFVGLGWATLRRPSISIDKYYLGFWILKRVRR